MNIPSDTFDASNLQEIQEKQEIETGRVIITHTGNALKEIHMKTRDASLKLSLVKGCTIVSAHLLGDELFDIDPDYQNVEKVTRTKGNPNIFPVFNQMAEGVRLEGAKYPLPNHGIARNSTWKAYLLPDLPEVLILQLKSDAETEPYYPYAFTYTQFITLDQSSLTIGQHIDALGAFGVGFHPYFRVKNKRDLDISGIEPGTRYWYLPNSLSKAEKDEVIAQDRSLAYSPGKRGSVNFAAGEVNHHFDLESVDKKTITMTDPGLNRRILIDRSDDYNGLTVWCNEGEENSVCVEPVTDRSGKISAKPIPWKGQICFTVEKLQ